MSPPLSWPGEPPETARQWRTYADRSPATPQRMTRGRPRARSATPPELPGHSRFGGLLDERNRTRKCQTVRLHPLRMPVLRRLLLALACIAGSATTLAAQDPDIIRGRVTGPDSVALEGANVT